MNNFSIEIPWWAGMLFLIFILVEIGVWTYFAYEAILKFILVWRKGFPPAHCDALGDEWKNDDEKLTKKVHEILLKAIKESEAANG